MGNSKNFGDACSSFGFCLLNKLKISTISNPIVFSPLALVHSLNFLRLHFEPETAEFVRISNAIHFALEEDKTIKILSHFNSAAKNSDRQIFCSLWCKNIDFFSKSPLPCCAPNKDFSVEFLPLTERSSKVNKWANRILSRKTKLFNPHKDLAEDLCVIYSVCYFNIEFKNEIFISEKKFLNQKMFEIVEKSCCYFKNDGIEFFKLPLSNEEYFISFVVPDNNKTINETLNHIIDPFNWNQIQQKSKTAQKSNKTFRLILPPFSALEGVDLTEKNLKNEYFRSDAKLRFKNSEKMASFKIGVLHTALVEFSPNKKEKSEKMAEKIDFEILLDRPFLIFVQHFSTEAMVLAAFIDPSKTDSEFTTGSAKNSVGRFRAGKSPPRGDKNFHLNLANNRSKNDKFLQNGPNNVQNGENGENFSIINRKLIPCASMSETGGCTYGDQCQFCHDIIGTA